MQKHITSTIRRLHKSASHHRLTDRGAWKERAIIWLAALVTGLIVVLFAHLTEHAIALFGSMTGQHGWLALAICPSAAILLAWLTRRFFAGAEGSGIPQVIAALKPETTPEKIGIFVSTRIALGKIVLGTAALAAGFSAGREGPSVQVGASIMHAFRRFLPQHTQRNSKHLILAGGAAGIAAAFNTPLAGIFFAIEELGKRFEEKTNGVLISAIVLAGLISISIQGNYIYFGRLAISNIDYRILLPVFVCSLVCGVAGGLFSRILAHHARPDSSRLGRWRSKHPYLWAGFCGLMVALLGLVSQGTAHGSGYFFTLGTLEGQLHMPWYYAPVKFAATVFTFLSGIPGGIFAPSLAIGVGIGAEIQPFLASVSPVSIYALCMAGFLAAVTQAPLTSFIIVMEMIDGHGMVISLMAASMLASLISRLFCSPLYSALADLQLAKIGQDHRNHV
ncbi:H+/Cl-antiporter ClcA [Formivibrio citricus]|uniref:H+/Cl-antiporter ClcA n=1 Tax=Formivibrio citricus TaxID=83765 RepID=A0A1I4YY89_9NEIS|nr:chloride channel protein [Formivibrio citricus]SFN42610.1 H+/Cl-antiporter ClcA [Formivibrio citricus]